MTKADLIPDFKRIGDSLEISLNTLERTRRILEFFEDNSLESFNLTEEEKKIFLKGTQKIKESINYVLEGIEDAENQVCSLCSKITPEKNLVYSVVIDSLDQVMKHD